MKNLVIACCLLLLSEAVSAQVKYNLSYDAVTKVYSVSLTSEATWDAPKNLVASAQIVLRVASGQDFTPAITSQVDGLVWADNAYIENPAGASGYKFVCIALVNGPTSKIGFAAGETTPLFTFTNAGGGCAGEVTLLKNDDPMVLAVRAAGFNVTQHMAVLGAHGNAFLGSDNKTVDCAQASATSEASGEIIGDVKVSPVPADRFVNLQWTLASSQNTLYEIVICDVQGREVWRSRAGDEKGLHTQQITVGQWPAGLYRIRFVAGNGYQSRSWNMMVVH
jgi:hypothetical protein